MKKAFTIGCVLIFIITLGVTTSNAVKKDDPNWTNLKILSKDISDHDLDSIMGHYSVSLGVRCSFCHAKSTDPNNKHLDFASDEKEEKGAARAMMKMTAAINKDFFNWQKSDQTDTIREVVRYTCHRGNAHPDAKAFLSLIDSTENAHRQPPATPQK